MTTTHTARVHFYECGSPLLFVKHKIVADEAGTSELCSHRNCYILHLAVIDQAHDGARARRLRVDAFRGEAHACYYAPVPSRDGAKRGCPPSKGLHKNTVFRDGEKPGLGAQKLL